MSFKKMCRLLACCKPGSNNNVTPVSIPAERSVTRVEVAAKPAPKRGHKYNPTMDDVLALVSTDPAEVAGSPALR